MRQQQKALATSIIKSSADIVRELKQEQAKVDQAAALANPYLHMVGQESVHEAPRVTLKGMWRIYLCSENATNFEMPGVSKDSTVWMAVSVCTQPVDTVVARLTHDSYAVCTVQFAKLMNVASVQLDALEKSNDEHRTLANRVKLDVDLAKVHTKTAAATTASIM